MNNRPMRNGQSGNRYKRNQQQNSRYVGIVVIGIIGIIILFMIGNSFGSKPDVFSSSESSGFSSGGNGAVSAVDEPKQETVPWDYKIVQSKVGDLIGGDMTIGENNDLLPNDDNYATGDAIWVLQYMNADFTIKDDNKNDIHLSSWDSIKTYRTKEAAEADMNNLKINLTADVDLVGVYKTEYEGKFRSYAVLTLPSGHTIKQPIDDSRYANYKDKKQVKVMLEEVHDFADYDLAMAKFRGWAD